MTRRRQTVPSYRLHKQSGQAVVTLPDGLGNRRDVLLGPHGSPESHAEYARVIAEWEANNRRIPPAVQSRADLTVNELVVLFLDHAERHYRHPDGRPTGEADGFKLSLRPLRELYGHTTAAQFGPLALKAVRERMVDGGLSRRVVNQRVGRVKSVFKWAVSEELVPAATYQALQTVSGLARGRSRARETAPVAPVPAEHVEAVRPFVRPGVWTMVRLQLLTGMRPGEVCRMRAADLDTTGATWVYTPALHKTAWRGRARVVVFGPKAQELIRPYLKSDPDAWLFSPRDEVAALRRTQRERRKTPVQPSQRDRRKAKPKRRPGECYTPHAYSVAVRRACVKARVPHWHPNQLRHAHATDVRRRYGLEAAQAVLGHARADVTQIYAERDRTVAARVAAEIG